MFGKPKEEPMPEKPAATTPETVLNIDPARLDSVSEEIARFLRKLTELRSAGTGLKPNHPAVKALRRASQDVTNEMVALRTMLKG